MGMIGAILVLLGLITLLVTGCYVWKNVAENTYKQYGGNYFDYGFEGLSSLRELVAKQSTSSGGNDTNG